MTDEATKSLSTFTELRNENDELRTSNARLIRELRSAKARTEDLVKATFDGAHDAMLTLGRVPRVKVPAPDKRKGGEVAIWDLGDWQGSKVTVSYNSDVMRERVMRYCDKAERITMIQRADHPVKGCVIILGGDMVEGLFNFPTQPFEIDATIHDQWLGVSRLIIDVVRRALSVYEWVLVVSEWGNHGRLGSKRSVIPKNDNIDRMCYTFAREFFELSNDGDRLTWQDGPEDIQKLEVGNYRAIVLHGDEPGRNGFVSPQTMVQYITRLQSGAFDWEFTDAYVHHYHNCSEYALPNGRGSVYYNGSTESDNRYARDGMAATATPAQRLHFVDPERGRVTAVYKVFLD